MFGDELTWAFDWWKIPDFRFSIVDSQLRSIMRKEILMAKKAKKMEEVKQENKEAFLNDPGEIVVPEYQEAKWMEGARFEYMCKARDGILKSFDWSKTEQGVDYWKTAYTKLYIMCKHMEVYMVLSRLG